MTYLVVFLVVFFGMALTTFLMFRGMLVTKQDQAPAEAVLSTKPSKQLSPLALTPLLLAVPALVIPLTSATPVSVSGVPLGLSLGASGLFFLVSLGCTALLARALFKTKLNWAQALLAAVLASSAFGTGGAARSIEMLNAKTAKEPYALQAEFEGLHVSKGRRSASVYSLVTKDTEPQKLNISLELYRQLQELQLPPGTPLQLTLIKGFFGLEQIVRVAPAAAQLEKDGR